MKGLSMIQGRIITFLLLMALILLFPPGWAGAQPEADPPPIEEGEEAVTEESGESSLAETVEAVIGEAMDAIKVDGEDEPAEPEEFAKYDYFILHSLEPDLPIEEWDVVARIPANSSFTYDEPGYFGFFMQDPTPEEPVEPKEPEEPEEPTEADFELDKQYKEALGTYEDEMDEYEDAIEGYEYYVTVYPDLLAEYEAEKEVFDSEVYSGLEHYFFYERTIPEDKPKNAVYRLKITQPVIKTPEADDTESDDTPAADIEDEDPDESDTDSDDAPAADIEDEDPDTGDTDADETPAADIVENDIDTDDTGSGVASPTDIVGAAPVTTDIPVSNIEPPPPPPRPEDLVFPEIFTYEDRSNDAGGAISIRWSTSESDNLIVERIPEEPEAEAAGEEEEPPKYDLETFIVEAWIFAPEAEDHTGIIVTTNVAELGGPNEFELDFVGIVDNPSAMDYGLGYHYRKEFITTKSESEIIGRHLIKVVATGDGIKKKLKGHVNVRKVAGKPVTAIKDDETQPDNMYKHYFQLGMDYSDHEGFPRWIKLMQDPIAVTAKLNVFNFGRWNTFLYAIAFAIIILGYIAMARKGTKLFVRRIAGLDHVEEAIGRATEMGKPILYIPGIGTMGDVATIAATNILGQVTRKVAEYDSKIIVPCKDPIVMTVAQEVCQEAYIDAGHPDKYNVDDVFFLTDDQFAYTAAVNGIMVRDRPATILLMGMFFAESLILAETGSSTGAIQIAGTDAIHQLPFFITACDYTLIGEELYAASAYLSKEPLLLGSLKGQDLAKLFLFILIFIGVILATLGIDQLAMLFSSPL